MTIPANDYPRPSNWQDFERLCVALLSAMHDRRFRRWGTAGQRKDGVDAWATLADGRVIALRFEGRTERYGQPLTRADLDASLEEVASFPHRIDELIILSAGTDDAEVQAHAAVLGASRKAAGQSSVAAWGWQTIGTHIAQSPKAQGAFYGREVRSSARKLALIVAAIVVVAGGAGSLFLGKNAIDASNAKAKDPVANVGNIAANLDELDQTYRQCQALLEKNAFTFSRELVETCRDPAAAQLAALSKKVDRQRSGFDAQAKTELERLLAIFHEDVRETVAVTTAAQAFDNAVVQSMKAGCAAGQPAAGDAAAAERAGAQAVVAQVRYYFLLKDFIIPELATAKEILLIHAGGVPAPERMKAAAGRMEQLLTERVAYAVKDTRSPFTLSSAKHAAARDAVPGADAAAEEARWRDVLAQSATQSLRGRTADIEALAACGALDKEAVRALAQPPGA